MSGAAHTLPHTGIDPGYYDWAVQVSAAGGQVLYLQQTQYPVLEVQLLLRERAREQMGEVEKTLLRLVGADAGSVAVMAALTGFAPHRLAPLVQELEGRGLLVSAGDGRFTLSELGTLSLEHGAEVIEIERAVLLCGITGRLLPREAYDVPRSSVQELSRRVRGRVLVDESQRVPLTNLRLDETIDRRAVNLPDEALQIVQILDYEPRFLAGTLAVYSNGLGLHQGHVQLAKAVLDWVSIERLLPLVEPLGWPKDEPAGALDKVAAELRAAGFELRGQGRLNEHGNPAFEVERVASEGLKLLIGLRPLALYLGSPSFDPVPIIRYPINGKDLLGGHPLTLTAVGSGLVEEIEALRAVNQAMVDYHNRPVRERTDSLKNYVARYLEQGKHDSEKALRAVEALGNRRLLRALDLVQE